MILSCSNPLDNNNDVVNITGKVLNACNKQPIENIDVYFRALNKYINNSHKIKSQTKTNSNGEFTFSGSMESVREAIYVAINHSIQLEYREDLPRIKVWGRLSFDSLYSIYVFKTSSTINKIIELPPRKRVTIVAKPDTLKSTTEFNFIRISESFTGAGTGTYSHQTQYYQDSLNILLAANMKHSICVNFRRGNNTQDIFQDFQVNCSDTTKVEIYY